MINAKFLSFLLANNPCEHKGCCLKFESQSAIFCDLAGEN